MRADVQELIAAHALGGELLEKDIEILEQQGIHSIPKVRHGLVVDEILAEACGGEYDLVVVGANPTEGSQRFLLEKLPPDYHENSKTYISC